MKKGPEGPLVHSVTVAKELAPAGSRSGPNTGKSDTFTPAAQSSGSKLPRHKSSYPTELCPPGYCPGMSLRSFTGSCCLRFLAIAVRILMLIASTASENAMAK